MKVAVIAGAARSLVGFRGTLLASLRSAGHSVVACATDADAGVAAGLKALDIAYRDVHLARRSRDPFGDLRYCLALRRIFSDERPDLVFAYTMKPVVYASLAAATTEVRECYSLISGLGYSFGDESFRQGLTQRILRLLLGLALQRNNGVIFQNQDDRDLFASLGLIRSSRSMVVRGSGVDLDRFPPVPTPQGGPRFLLLARMLRAKGTELFAEAARRVKETCPAARFVMAGRIETGPDAIPAADVRKWHDAGHVEYLGRLADVREELATCTAYVLPSYYREGTPRSILEAMSTGRAIVTTDAPGCRDTVFDAGPADADGVRLGLNGMLIPPRSLDPLVCAMRRLADRPGLTAVLGNESRRLAQEYYDVRDVDRQMIAFMGLGPSP